MSKPLRHPSPPSLALVLAILLAVGACAWSESEAIPPGEPLGTPGAHEHGVARLNLAVDGEVLAVSLVIPDVELQGFEHAPRTADERRLRAEALQRLRGSFHQLLVLESRLGCQVEGELVLTPDLPDADDAHADDHAHDHAHDGGGAAAEAQEHAHAHGHTETRVEARFRCERDPTGSTVELGFGTHFPGIERVDLQSLSSDRQLGRRVAAQGTRFTL